MIPQRSLSLLANRIAQEGGRRIGEAVLERDYCLAWFLVGLSASGIREKLAFKGGTALKRCYFGDYRFSEDLDFTLLDGPSLDEIKDGFEAIYRAVRSLSGIEFRFARADPHQHSNSHTFYLSYEGPLPPHPNSEVKVDVTIRERIVLPIVDRAVVRGYDEYSDLPPDASIKVYSLNEIIIEKIAALTDRARNEPRDLYDIWYLVDADEVELDQVRPELESKLAFRERSLAGIDQVLDRKEPVLKALWEKRLASQMTSLPEFEGVFRAVRRGLRQAGISG